MLLLHKNFCFLFKSTYPFEHDLAVLDSTMALEKLIYMTFPFLQNLLGYNSPLLSFIEVIAIFSY